MQSGPGPGQGHDVAVGPSRTSAASVFGSFFDDVHVTSYEDFRTEIEPDSIRSVALVGGAEAAGLLTDLAAAAAPPERILIGLGADLNGRDDMFAALAASPRLRPVELAAGIDGTVVVRLVPADQVASADADRVLAQLRALEPARLEDRGVPVEDSARPFRGRLMRLAVLVLVLVLVLVAVLLLS